MSASSVTFREPVTVSAEETPALSEGIGSRGINSLDFVAQGQRYSLWVALTRAEREAVYRFVYDMYRDAGFCEPSRGGMRVSLHDALPGTATIVVESDGRPVATATVVPDSPLGLPLERMYGPEVELLRDGGRSLCEINRLVCVGTRGRKRLDILLHVFRAAYYYSRTVLDADDFLIVVSPEHAHFYRRVLQFEDLGGLRADPHANGAASLALRLELSTASERMREKYAQQPHSDFYDFFVRFANGVPEAMKEWYMLLQTVGVMTEEDFLYFFVEKSDLLRKASEAELSYLQERVSPDPCRA